MIMRTVEAINQSLHGLMDNDPCAYFIGQDILDPYGGAFKASKGLSTRFPQRVLSSPISEAAMIGFGIGLASRGCMAIIEVMFGDFLALGMDQLLNHAAKFEWISGNRISLPLIVRAPMGGGRGYGPTHSQSLEKHFCGIPGLNVYALHRYMNPSELYEKAARDRHPTLIIESKVLYAMPIKTADGLHPHGKPDVILVAYGAMVDVCANAAKTLREEDELAVEILPIEQLSPFADEAIEGAAKRCNRVVAVEEAPGGWGFGAECAYRLANTAVKFAHVRRGVPPHSSCARP